jgi:hypothetical protein
VKMIKKGKARRAGEKGRWRGKEFEIATRVK